MSTILPWILGICIIGFFIRIFMLWRELWKNYKYLRTKYPVSIWKLPSRNLHLMDETDRKTTRRLYIRYILNLIIGMVVLIGLSALIQLYK